MLEINDMAQWLMLRQNLPTDKSVGFVPTMGNLHMGHAQLVKQSIDNNDMTVVSIFINEKQFNQPEDYEHYPRTLEQDLALLAELGVDYCLVPSTDVLYADDFQYRICSVSEHPYGEDRHRPNHFTGVLTVVMKLLQLIRPHKAYFGEKDYQQLEMIRGMVKAFFLSTDIISVPTVREQDGLAFSSRNRRLSLDGRKKASQFAQIFLQAKQVATLKQQLEDAAITVDYIEEIGNRRYVAVLIEGLRLIDNLAIT